MKEELEQPLPDEAFEDAAASANHQANENVALNDDIFDAYHKITRSALDELDANYSSEAVNDFINITLARNEWLKSIN